MNKLARNKFYKISAIWSSFLWKRIAKSHQQIMKNQVDKNILSLLHYLLVKNIHPQRKSRCVVRLWRRTLEEWFSFIPKSTLNVFLLIWNYYQDNMVFSFREAKKIRKRVNTDDTIGTVLQYIEEYPTKNREMIVSRRWTHQIYIVVILLTDLSIIFFDMIIMSNSKCFLFSWMAWLNSRNCKYIMIFIPH